MTIELKTTTYEIFEAVSRKTAYVAGKMPGEEDVVDRITTVDEDNTELEELFGESRAELISEIGGMLRAEDYDGYNYTLSINTGEKNYGAMTDAMNLALKNYFVYSILGRWFLFTNKEESALYKAQSLDHLGKLKASLMNNAFLRRCSTF